MEIRYCIQYCVILDKKVVLFVSYKLNSTLVWVVHGDTNLYNLMGMTVVLQCKGGL